MATERAINARRLEREAAQAQRLAAIEAKLEALAETVAGLQAPIPEPRQSVGVRNAKK